MRFTVTREAACDGRDVQTHPQSFKEQNRVSALRTEEMPDKVEADTLLSRGLPAPRVEGSPSGCPCTAGGRRSSATFSGTTGNHDLAPPASFPPSLTLDHMLDGQVSTRWNPPRCHLLCISLECGNPDCPSLSTDPGPLGIHSFFFFLTNFFLLFSPLLQTGLPR